MNFLRAMMYVPLFAWVLIAYNILMLVSDAMVTNPTLFTIPLASTAEGLEIGVADLFLLLGLVFLYFEILKAARATRRNGGGSRFHRPTGMAQRSRWRGSMRRMRPAG